MARRPDTLYVIAYDIVTDRRRTRVANLLSEAGMRVNLSVFEVWATPLELEALLDRLRRAIDPATDQVRVYSLCQRCQADIRVLGSNRYDPHSALDEV